MAKVRLVDIGNRLGVSSVTVHNALSGEKGVSAEMREKIIETAREMGYRPGSAARRPKEDSNGSARIGVVIAENYLADHTTFYGRLYQKLSLAASARHCYTTIEVLKKEDEIETLKLPEIVQNGSVDVLIVLGQLDRRYIAHLKEELEIPVAYLDFYYSEIAEDCVVADNFYGMYLLTQYLFERGVNDMAYVGSIHATSSIMDRYCGFMKALTEHRRVLPPEWLIEDRDSFGTIGFELPDKLPGAFVCNCDLAAGLVIEKLQKRGMRVPEDCSVVGFDNFLYPGHADMNITTFEVNLDGMVEIALDKVLGRFNDPESPDGILEIVSGRMVIKKSVR